MKKMLPLKESAVVLILAFAAIFILHVLVILGIVPIDVAWGGQVSEGSTALWVLEIFALLVTILFAFFIAAKSGLWPIQSGKRSIKIGAWLVFAYLLLNTLGNLASEVTVERFVFAPITLILAVLSLRVAIE